MSDTDIDTDETIDVETDAQIDAGEPEPDAVVDDTTQDDPDDQDENQADQGRRAGVRQRLAAAEQERDALRDTLARQQQSIIDREVTAAGLDGRLMAAAGYSTVGAFINEETGLIDHDRVTSAAQTVAGEFRVAPQTRRPAVDPMVGRGESGTSVSTDLGDILRQVARGTG